MGKCKCCCCKPEPDYIDVKFQCNFEGKLFNKRLMKFKPVSDGIEVEIDGEKTLIRFGNLLTVSMPLTLNCVP